MKTAAQINLPQTGAVDPNSTGPGKTPVQKPAGYPPDWPAIAQRIKDAAGWRCERCKEPHNPPAGYCLTVHHLDGDKANCEDWNLAALCQRCHLKIQARVVMEQLFFLDVLPVSGWFKPHLEGYVKSLSARCLWRDAREQGLLKSESVQPGHGQPAGDAPTDGRPDRPDPLAWTPERLAEFDAAMADEADGIRAEDRGKEPRPWPGRPTSPPTHP